MALRTGTIRTEIKVEKADQAQKALRDIEKGFDNLGKGGAGIDKALRGIGPAAGASVAAVLAIKAGLDAVVRSAEAVTRAVYDLGQRGGQVSAVATAFERFGDSALLGRLQSASGQLVDNFELMSRTTQVLRSGIVDADTWVETVESVTRAAQDMGRDVDASLQAVATTLSGGGVESLNALGINVLRVREQVSAMGDTMESTTGRMAAVRIALQQMREDMGDVDNSASNVGDAWQQIIVVARNWYDALARSFASNQDLINFFTNIAASLRAALPDASQWGTEIAEAVMTAVQATVAFGNALLPVARVVVQTTALLADLGGALEAVTTLGAAPLVRWLLGIPNPAEETANALRLADSALGDLGTALNAVNTGLQTLDRNASQAARTVAERLAPTVEEAAGIARNSMAPGMDSVRESVGRARLGVDAMTDSIRALSSANRDAAASTEHLAEVTLEMRRQVQAGREAAEADTQAQQAQVVAASIKSAQERAARRSGGGTRTRPEQLRVDDEVKAFEELQRQIGATYQTQIEELARVLDGIDAQAEAERALNDARMEAGQERKEFEQEQHERRMEELEQYRESYAAYIEKLEEEREARRETAQGALEATSEGLGVVGDALGQAIGYQEEQVANLESAMQAAGASQEQIAAATKDQVDQIERLKKAEGAFLVAKEAVEMAISIAQAISSFANQDYVGGAMHIAAAAAHGVAMAMAAARLGGGGAAAVPAVSAGTFRASEPENVEDSNTDTGGTTITNVYSLGNSQEEMGRAMELAQWERRRVGLGSGVPVGIQFDA